MNVVTLLGRITETPQAKPINDTSVINFTLAVRRKYKSSGDADADFIRCTAWGKTAEMIEKYFNKGDMICVIGEIRNNKYVDKYGEVKYSVSVNVNEMYFTGSSIK